MIWRLNKNLLILAPLGFISGLPLALTASTLSAWLTEAGINMQTIGIFASIGTPYAIKFLWSPLVDGARIPVFCTALGRRKGWLIFTQILLVASLFFMSVQTPEKSVVLIAFAAFAVALFSATQDIILDALRIEILPEPDQALGAAIFVFGYRIGMLASGAGALFLSEFYGWTITYQIMGAAVLAGIFIGFFIKEPDLKITKTNLNWKAWFIEFVVKPFVDFLKRSGALWILAFIVFYKMTDAFLGMMTTPFLLKLGFSKSDIAEIVKLFGLIATIAGGFAGGLAVKRFGIIKMLYLGLIFQALTNLLYILLIYKGADKNILAFVISCENFAGGIGTTAFVAYLGALCNREFTATQYALLNSFASFGRTWLSTPSGLIAEKFGWEWFFAASACFSIPAFFVLKKLKNPNV